jgi:hypothetical protein
MNVGIAASISNFYHLPDKPNRKPRNLRFHARRRLLFGP